MLTLLVWLTVALSVGVSSRTLSPLSPPIEKTSVRTSLHVGDEDSGRQLRLSANPLRIRTCQISPGPGEFGTRELAVHVELLDDGSELLSHSGSEGVVPASVLKLFTAVAAWQTLGPNYRMKSFARFGEGDSLWLIGGGDPTLSFSSRANYYGVAGSLSMLVSDVAEAVRKRNLGHVTLRVDLTHYANFSSWEDSWPRKYIREGVIAPVTALQVDGGRENSDRRFSPRYADPVEVAIQRFAVALEQEVPGLVVSVGPPGRFEGGPLAGFVESPTVRDLVKIMLRDSDNTIAEALVREVAIFAGMDSPALAIESALGDSSIATSGIVDGSGLSPQNRLRPRDVVKLLRRISDDEHLREMVDLLPSPGEPGTLRERFDETGWNVDIKLFAKTGTLRGLSSLAGYLSVSPEEQLLFFVSVSSPGNSASPHDAVDSVVEEFARCGENLAHWRSQVLLASE